MTICGICKQNKKITNRWVIQEHAVDNSLMRNFRVCDDCGAGLIRSVLKQMSRDGTVPEKIDLGKTGLVNSVHLGEDNVLEVTLSMDLAKARKLVLDKTE